MPRPPRQILTPGARGMCTDKVSEGSRRRGVWRTCVPCASAPSCELGSNLLRPARDPAKSAPCYPSLSDCLPGGSGRVRRRSTAARGALSPQPQPAAPPMERSAQRQLRCPAIGLSVATCRLPASSLGFRSRAKKVYRYFVRFMDPPLGLPLAESANNVCCSSSTSSSRFCSCLRSSLAVGPK